eukprot:GSMAST32.ASY1.ANO1.1361.1 assembled CDS
MNFQYTVMSKRKLGALVDMGEVEGWDDPRFPTVQGILRRGVQLDAVKKFILEQGFSRRIVDMEWDKFWSSNRKVLDRNSPRYMAIDCENKVPFTLKNFNEITECSSAGITVALHPKRPEMGKQVKFISKTLYIEHVCFIYGEEVTLMRWGNAVVDKIIRDPQNSSKITGIEGHLHLKGDFKLTKHKLTWVAKTDDLLPIEAFEFGHIVTKKKMEQGDDIMDFLTSKIHPTKVGSKMFADSHMRRLKAGDVMQIERRGYFRVDRPYISQDKPMICFLVPDGKKKAMSTLSTKLQHQ